MAWTSLSKVSLVVSWVEIQLSIAASDSDVSPTASSLITSSMPSTSQARRTALARMSSVFTVPVSMARRL